MACDRARRTSARMEIRRIVRLDGTRDGSPHPPARRATSTVPSPIRPIGGEGARPRRAHARGASLDHLAVIAGIWSLDGPSVDVADVQRGSSTSVWFDGRLDNRDDLLARLAPTPPDVDLHSDAALTRAIYERRGDEFVD